MTILTAILAYLAGESNTVPATNTEDERLLAKAAQKIRAGLLPVPAAPVSPAASADAGKVPTVKSDGTYELAAIPTELPTTTGATVGDVLTVTSDGPAWSAIPTEVPDPSAVTDGYVLTAASGEATWAAIPANEPAET